MQLLAIADIDNGTGVALGVVITIAVAAFAVGKLWSSIQTRLTLLEEAQKQDNEWRQQIFAPWRSKVNRSIDLLKYRGQPGQPDDHGHVQPRSEWPQTDEH